MRKGGGGGEGDRELYWRGYVWQVVGESWGGRSDVLSVSFCSGKVPGERVQNRRRKIVTLGSEYTSNSTF